MKEPYWYDEIFEDKFRLGMKVHKTVFSGKSDLQQIDVIDTAAFGRVLAIDNIFMTSEKDEFYYHEMLVHPAMVTCPNIERALVIGGGDGGTVREILTYDEVKHVDMVEIDAMVVEVSKRYLKTIGTAWDDPRLHVRIGDGIDYAINAEVLPYDIIFLDGCDPIGPAEGLFTEDFYRGCARLLRPGGVFTIQSESPITMPEVFTSIQETLKRVFESVHPYFGPVPIYASGDWSWTYASQTTDRFALIESRVKHQEARCRYYNRDIHRGAFALPNSLKSALK